MSSNNKSNKYWKNTVCFKGENQAFLDAEYLCAKMKKGAVDDVISIGLIVTNRAHEELARYYSTVRLVKGHRLTPLIAKLTGLTNEELRVAPTYEKVMQKCIGLVKKYEVGKICVWGGDKSNFVRDFESRTLDKDFQKDVMKFINTFENIQKDVSLDVTGGLDSGMSLADMKTICGLGGHVEHNALSDAEDMLNCIRVIEAKKLPYDGVEAAQYKHFRAEYVKNRSFNDHDDEPILAGSMCGEEFLKELEACGFKAQPKTKAFVDDLRFLLGKGDITMGTYSEMMDSKNH